MKPSEILSAYGETTAVASDDYLLITDHALTETTLATTATVFEGVQESKGVYYTKGDIAAAVTAIGSDECDLVVDVSETLGANLDLSSVTNIRPKFRKGAVITVPNGVTYTGNGLEEVVPYQVFNCTGTGVVAGLHEVTPEMFGATSDGTTDDSASYSLAVAALSDGGILQGTPGKTYLINTQVTITGSNLVIDLNGSTLKKTANANYILAFQGAAQSNITVRNGILQGFNATVDAVWANGGILAAVPLATPANYMKGFTLENVTFTDFGQYGAFLGEIDNLKIKNVSVLNHGSTTGTTVGIGFVLFPKDATRRNAVIDGLYAEINPSSTIAASAAIKLQNMWNLTGTNVSGKGGTESVVVASQLHHGNINGVNVEGLTANSGMLTSSYNVDVPLVPTTLSAQANATDTVLSVVSALDLNINDKVSIILDDASVHTTTISAVDTGALTITVDDAIPSSRHADSGENVQLWATMSVSNLRAKGVFSAAYNSGDLHGSMISNVDLRGVRAGYWGTSNDKAITNCVFSNIRAPYVALNNSGMTAANSTFRGIQSDGYFSANASTSEFSGIRTNSESGTGRFYLVGSSNKVRGLDVLDSSTYGIHVVGDSNDFEDFRVIAASSSPIYVPSGSDNNSFRRYTITGNISNAGTGNTFDDVPLVSADKGNAAATLTTGLSESTAIWATPLTGGRAVTLSTEGCREGSTFTIIRTATATGVYNLNVGTGPLKALASAGTWCKVKYDGSAWFLAEYGTL